MLGGLILWADAASPLGGARATAAAHAAAVAGGPGRAAAGYGLLATNLQLSAALYADGTGYPLIAAALAGTWALSWAVLDRTRQGAALSLVCAAGAPLAELVLMGVWGTWHYSAPDLGGVFVSFVPCCYGGYVPLLCALTRALAARADAARA